MSLRNDILKPGVPSLRVGAWQVTFRLQDPITRAFPLVDDPATLARLEAIMSDRVDRCPNCGRDTYVCRAVGCDEDAALLLTA